MSKKFKEARTLLMAIGGFYLLSSIIALMVIRMMQLLSTELKDELPLAQLNEIPFDTSLMYYVPILSIVGLIMFVLGLKLTKWKEKAASITLFLSIGLLVFLIVVFKPLFTILQGPVFNEMPNDKTFELINFGVSIFQIISIYASVIVPQWIVYRKLKKLDSPGHGETNIQGEKTDILDGV